MVRRRLCVGLSLGSLLLGAIGSPARALADDPAETPSSLQDAARVRFTRGVKLFEDGDFKLALIEFERAYSISPSYKILFNIGRVQQRLGQYAKAVITLERYLADGGARVADDRRAQVEGELRELRQRTATLSVRTPLGDAEVSLDGVVLSRGAVEGQVVDAGEHRLRVSRPGYQADERTLVLAGGDVVQLDVPLRALPPPVRPPTTPAPPPRPPAKASLATSVWIAGGTSLALAAGAAVCGVVALGESASLRDARDTPGTAFGDRDRLATRAATFGVVADVLSVGAVVAAGVAIYLFVTRPSAVGAVIGPGRVGGSVSF